MKILVSGAGGFVGCNLVRALAREETDDVFGIVLAATGLYLRRYNEIQVDLATRDFTEKLPQAIDVVIHLAQSLGYREFPSTACDLFAVNVESTFHLLEWARTHGATRFYLASTGNVYRPSRECLLESDPCEPDSFYGATKLAAETLTRQYARFFETVALRIFGVYGPGQRNMLVPNMIGRVVAGDEITLAEGRGLVFTPIYIDDCVEILLRLLHSAGSSGHSVFNLGGDEVIDLKTILTILGVEMGQTPNVRSMDGSATFLVGNSSRLYSQVGLTPKFNLAAGLKQTVRERGERNGNQ